MWRCHATGDGDLAARIMQEYGVTINDLHSLSKAFPFEDFKKPGDVHYTMDGYKKLAEQVADKLLTTLGGEQENLSDKK